MSDSNTRLCGQCGKQPAIGRIYFFLVLSDKDQAKLGAKSAALDMLLCEPCAAKAYKHMKRMFSLSDFELSDRQTREFPA